jgi:hypothetical protein
MTYIVKLNDLINDQLSLKRLSNTDLSQIEVLTQKLHEDVEAELVRRFNNDMATKKKLRGKLLKYDPIIENHGDMWEWSANPIYENNVNTELYGNPKGSRPTKAEAIEALANYLKSVSYIDEDELKSIRSDLASSTSF